MMLAGELDGLENEVDPAARERLVISDEHAGGYPHRSVRE